MFCKYKIFSNLFAWILPTKEDRKIFRKLCNDIDSRNRINIIQKRYPKLIKKINKKEKIKIIFLNSENSKWSYQSLYDLLSKNPKYEIQVLITVGSSLLKRHNTFLDFKNQAINSYKKFKENGMNVDYAFDFQRKKYIDLKKFNPDIIFYEQPWDLPQKQSIVKTSKYALSFYCSYGASITNGQNEYSESFYKEVLTYFVDNPSIVTTLLNHGFNIKNIYIAGNLKLDAYRKPINISKSLWKDNSKKHIIYAPHHSFSSDSILKFGTFDKNYKCFFNLAKNHPEYEFIFKPHPQLKKNIVINNLMSEEDMKKYFQMWNDLPNAQVYEYCDYFNLFRTSDLLITDCNSFLYEYLPTLKPVIQLINKYSVGHNDFGSKLISGFYQVNNWDELNEKLKLILEKQEDPLLKKREAILQNVLIQPDCGVARTILNYIEQMLVIGGS